MRFRALMVIYDWNWTARILNRSLSKIDICTSIMSLPISFHCCLTLEALVSKMVLLFIWRAISFYRQELIVYLRKAKAAAGVAGFRGKHIAHVIKCVEEVIEVSSLSFLYASLTYPSLKECFTVFSTWYPYVSVFILHTVLNTFPEVRFLTVTEENSHFNTLQSMRSTLSMLRMIVSLPLTNVL